MPFLRIKNINIIGYQDELKEEIFIELNDYQNDFAPFLIFKNNIKEKINGKSSS